MAHIHIPHEVPLRYLERSRGGVLLGAGMFVVGLVAFVVTLATDAHTAWVSYVSNWLFFTSVATGAVMFTVATTIVSARWNWSLRRVSVAFAAYLPIAFVLMLPMLGLREGYFPWIEEMAHDPILQAKQAWLNIPFLVTRNLVGALVLFGMALYFAYLAVRPDLGLAQGAAHDDAGRARWRERFTTGWLGQEVEEVRSWRRMSAMAPTLVMVYAVVMSVFAYDWVMSLEPHWFSTLFGGWFFMGAFWGGIAATAVAAMWIRKQHVDFTHAIGLQQRHDVGKLAFGFTVFWAYLFWSQYIVIWYGKLPWEQAWIIRRSDAPWGGLSALVIVLCFVVPFIGLIGRAPKLRPGGLATFTSLILVGLWLERYVILAPSVYHEGDPVFGIWHPLIALLFAGPMLLAVRWFWSTFPVLQVWQPLAPPESLEAERHDLGVPMGRTAERMGPGTWSAGEVEDAEH
jgi:hypothetical protein